MYEKLALKPLSQLAFLVLFLSSFFFNIPAVELFFISIFFWNVCSSFECIYPVLVRFFFFFLSCSGLFLFPVLFCYVYPSSFVCLVLLCFFFFFLCLVLLCFFFFFFLSCALFLLLLLSVFFSSFLLN